MHLLVLSAFRQWERWFDGFWRLVSMHLLVLSAFRLAERRAGMVAAFGLNAPFGAQCFPTTPGSLMQVTLRGLNAPFGAQCFPTERINVFVKLIEESQCTFWCSVLSDSNPETKGALRVIESQCTFWCSVLSDEDRRC